MVAASLVALLGVCAHLAAAHAHLKLEYSVERATAGFCLSTDGRKFLYQRYSETASPQIVELFNNGSTALWPNAEWNLYNETDPDSGSDPTTSFVSIDGARIGPDGRYWVVDGGAAGVNHTTKLVGVNLTTNSVDKLYYLDNIKAEDSNIDDVRFSATPGIAYLSDTAGALLILNMTTGDGIRVLANASSAQPWYPVMFNHTLVPDYDLPGDVMEIGLDQIEVSPDGVYLYYQACQGGLYRIETALLNAALTNATLADSLGDYAEAVALTPSTGGTCIDADGNIYASDTNLLAIWKITPDGYASILFQDDRLLWADQLWITADKKLWLPASQMRPGSNGLMAAGPNNIYSWPIDAGPSPIDHA